MRRRTSIVATLLLGVAFGVGGLAGMALEEALGLDWFDFLDEDDDEAEDRLLAGLDLDRDQRARAEAILEREEDHLEDYWENRIPEIHGILHESYAEIRALLTPAQQVVFDRRVRELGGRIPAEVRD
jgi:hypothetical protein